MSLINSELSKSYHVVERQSLSHYNFPQDPTPSDPLNLSDLIFC